MNGGVDLLYSVCRKSLMHMYLYEKPARLPHIFSRMAHFKRTQTKVFMHENQI